MAAVAESRRVPLTRMRRAVARVMTASARVPQFTVEMDVDAAALGAWRETRGVSFSDALTAACAQALVEHPDVNASFAEDAIVEYADVNVGIAVALDDGLIAPAIRNADRLSLGELQAERVRLTEAARAGTLDAEEVLCATFTISNLGPLGIARFRALVVPPQAAILAVGALTAERRIAVALSCDHRVLDGAPAARFLGDVVGRLQEREWLEGLA
jgi:pyruvate/2-oxoglutarate dehydrogenase complex dihydrolipoamide acyltransferase (E2) component